MALPEYIQKQRSDTVAQVVKDIKEGKPFFWDSEHYGKKPFNISKGNDYHGLNRMRLMLASQKNKFTDSRWGTYQQAKSCGWQIRKGETGIHIEWWSYPEKEKNINCEEKEITKDTLKYNGPIVRSYVVFNAQQMDNVPPEYFITIDESKKNACMENLIKNCEAKIYFDEAFRNYYQPSNDEIHMLPREKFKTLDGFYATCVHEIAHSTGHPSRLNRDITNMSNKEEYAKEELRAELTSMFIAQEWGLTFDKTHYQNHTAYLQSWAKVLNDDPNELYRAAAKAQEAVDYIEKNMLLKELAKEELKKTSPEEKIKNKIFTKGKKLKTSSNKLAR